MGKRGFLAAFLFWGILVCQGQDPRMAHPFLWKTFNNPGHTGFDGRTI